MEIHFQQLQQQLKKGLAPIYLISGDEFLLVEEAVSAIRTQAKNLEFTERELFHVEPGFDWQNFLLNLNNLSLFFDKSVVELKIPNSKPGDIGSKVLQTYAKNPSKNKVLIIVTGKLDAATKKTNWVKAITETGIFLPIWQLDKNQLTQWVINKLKTTGIFLETNDIKFLVDHVEGNLFAAAQEIEKLSLLYGKTKITSEQLISAITNSTTFTVYDLADTMLNGDAGKALRILEVLRGEGMEPAIILWAITREIRNLITIILKINEGNNLEQVLQQQRVRLNQKNTFKKACQRFKNVQPLENILAHAFQIDLMIKGVKTGDVWRDLAQLLILIDCY